jgi:uncharacterized damage-inducible protein DinB
MSMSFEPGVLNASFAETFRRWFLYEKESHAKVLNSLRVVPEEKRSAREYGKAVSILAHVAAARMLWLFRLGGAPSAPVLADMFPDGLDLSEVEERFERMHHAWDGFLARLDDPALFRFFHYTSLEGEPFRNTVGDVLTQLFGHSSYHRGQIALLLRSIGAEPAITDFVFWTREPTG